MLFNSYVFVFVFLPFALAGFHVMASLGRRAAVAWLVLVSVIFYGWWNPHFVILLVASVGLNYAAAEAIAAAETRPAVQAGFLTLAIAVNLTVLGYYKYLTSVIHMATGLGLIDNTMPDIVLPLGISFYTFTQIGYLIDVKQGIAKERGLLNYVLFVTFFPHLIAGPILHNREIMPQFGNAILTTYGAVLVASVFFRAPSVGSGLALLAGMVGLHGLDQMVVPPALLAILGEPGRQLFAQGTVVAISLMDFLDNISQVLGIVALYFIVWGLPNTQQIMFRFIQSSNRIRSARVEHFVWQPSRGWAMAIGAAACVSVVAIGGTTEFLYFKF